jgi:hypothetical protein
MYCYYLRNAPAHAPAWKKNYNWEDGESHKVMSLYNTVRYTECILLEHVRCLEQKKPLLQVEIDEAQNCFNKLKIAANKWPVFKPRYLHLRAYYCRINNKISQTVRFLKKANKAASEQGNILEECWTMLHSTCWFGGYAFDKSAVKHLDWKLAKTYTPLQWCQVLYPLPIY